MKFNLRFFYYLSFFLDILEESFGVSKQDLLSGDIAFNHTVNPAGSLILLERTWYNGSKEVILSTVEVNVNSTGILKLCVS